MIWKDVLIIDYFNFKRGQRLIDADIVGGDIPYISSSKEKNGRYAYISPPDFMERHENKLTIANSGSVGFFFYHPYEFVASDHATVLWPKDDSMVLNENIALFLKPIFETVKPKFNFGREISDNRIRKLMIKLPFEDENSKNPDWNYMMIQISQLKKAIDFQTIFHVPTNYAIKTENWHCFRLNNELFKIYRGTRLTKETRLFGNTPLVTAGYLNQGVASYIDPKGMEVYSNCITIDMFGNCFYRDYEFCCDDNILVLQPEFCINLKVALFIISVINLDKFKFSFGRQYRKKHVIKHVIKLPSISISGKQIPDFDYMERIITSTSYSNLLQQFEHKN